MGKLIIHQDKIDNLTQLMALCPFGAMEEQNGQLVINAACKMCRLCVTKGPKGAVVEEEEIKVSKLDKNLWKGILVYVDQVEGEIHPVTYELIGKALELANKISQPIHALMIGYNVLSQAKELLHYGIDKVFLYDHKELERFNIEIYTNIFEHAINQNHPSAILVGATSVGRQLAPRVAARMKTGLTADCTVLEMNENTDLSQIRPAFGGNIMAHIVTPNHRPQMATVRYKVMNAAIRKDEETGEIIRFNVPEEALHTNIEVLDIVKKEKEKFIESADILVVAGRGVKKQDDLTMLQELADLLGGQLACTRPLAEAGWVPAKCQVGLSGRTVRPKLIITCGVSGAIQFVAGMNHSELIIAINNDDNAAIFKTAHYGIVGNLYEIVPSIIEKIRRDKE